MITYTLIICCAALWLWCWSLTRSVQRISEDLQEVKRCIKTETRCNTCSEREFCPARNTGVSYPCPYYEEEKQDGTKE